MHADPKNDEVKLVFVPAYNNKQFNQCFIRKNVQKIKQRGQLKDRFIHQVDDQGSEFRCWRVHIPTDTATGYYIGQDGQKHCQYFITVWIVYLGILSVYPSDGHDEKTRATRFLPKSSGKGQIIDYLSTKYNHMYK